MLTLKVQVSKKDTLEWADSVMGLTGNSYQYEMASADTLPGFKTVSSFTLSLCSNQGGPITGV